MPTSGDRPWRIAGEEFVSCNCDWSCPCQFNARPTQGNCHGLIAWRIDQGHFGATTLDGMRFAFLISWPGAIHEGDGTLQLIVDDSADEEQHRALERMASGEEGGAYFEIFASVTPDKRPTARAPIRFQVDRSARRADVRVEGVAESSAEPIRNPTSGDEHRIRIEIPGGFEYEVAEVGNTVAASARGDEPLSFELRDSYAQFNAFDWSRES